MPRLYSLSGVLAIVFALACLSAGCGRPAPFQGYTADTLPTVERPLDTWVLRSVLDGRARMVTLALSDSLWVAYDATQCALYKAWQGDVRFEGTVYTTAHGPQPTSQGIPYWIGQGQAAWTLTEQGGTRTVEPVFRGYRFEQDRVVLQYELPLFGGGVVQVEERPEYVTGPDGLPGLARLLSTANVPPGVQVGLRVEGAAFSAANQRHTDGTWEPGPERRLALDWGTVYQTTGRLLLRSNGTTTLTQYFSPSTPVPDPEVEIIPEIGTRLANLIDTEAVRVDGSVFYHTDTGQWRPVGGPATALGPVNLKFHTAGTPTPQPMIQAEVVEQLQNGVNGWVGARIAVGAAPVTVTALGRMQAPGNLGRHPLRLVRAEDGTELARTEVALQPDTPPGTYIYADLETPVTLDAGATYYLVSEEYFGGDYWYMPGLAGPALAQDAQADSTPQGEGVMQETQTITVDGEAVLVEPGLAERVYEIGSPMSRLFPLVEGQTPNHSVAFTGPGIWGPEHFGGHSEYFIAHFTGFMPVDVPGTYRFKLGFRDGGRLLIDDQVVVAEGQEEATVELDAGYHPVRLELYQNTGEMGINWQWMPPGTTEWAWIDYGMFKTPAGEVRVTSPGNKLIQGLARITPPGHGIPLADVHPSYDLMTIRPETFKPKVGGMDFLPDGRLAICAWEADGGVYLLDGVQGDDRDAITVKKIASGLAEPLGLKVVEGDIYVMQKQELTQLIDHDGDDIIDEYRSIANGWGVTANFHEFAFGLVYRDDHFYGTLAIAIDPGGKSTSQQSPDRGQVVKIARDGTTEFLARGLRTPNGIGVGYNDELYIADNQGDWLPSSKILRLEPGAFYGNRSVARALTASMTETPPVVWLPQGEIGNSPSAPVAMQDGPYAGQMLHGEVTHGGIKRVFVEEVDGVYQGAVFRFTQGLESGVNRLVWGPDGALYIGGVGAPGNWGHIGKNWYGLQRLTYNGTPAFEMLAVRAKTNGLEIEFTEPLAEGLGASPEGYRIEQWYYESTAQYGGPKLGLAALPVSTASVSADRKRVFLEIPGLKAGHVVFVQIATPLQSAAGRSLWSTDAWYTLNRIPRDAIGVVDPTQVPVHNTLTAEEADWQLLFDGKTFTNWRGFRQTGIPEGWSITEAGELYFSGNGGGDLITNRQYDNFELKLEWKISPSGNSGIFFRGTEDHNNIWETAPEVQILDNQRHPDGARALTSAGANYALHAPPLDVTRPVGQYNAVHLIVSGPYVEHWLNGHKVAEYELWSDEWEALVAGSKFSGMAGYGRNRTGHIGLQDHGDPVWFRNIKIRPL